jgi:hypothetical protein
MFRQHSYFLAVQFQNQWAEAGGPGLTVCAGDAIKLAKARGGAVAQLEARLDGIEEVVGSNPIGSTNPQFSLSLQ